MSKEYRYINLSTVQAQYPKISQYVYQLKQLPNLVQTFAIRVNHGKAFGIGSIFKLVEVPAALVVLNVGLPEPWRSCYAEKSKYQIVDLKIDRYDEGEDDKEFSWECACFEGEQYELEVSEYYGFIDYEFQQFEIQQLLPEESKIIDNEAFLKYQYEVNGTVLSQDLLMTDIDEFIVDYQEFIKNYMVPEQLNELPLKQLISDRFSMESTLENREAAYANEIFVDFSAIDSKYEGEFLGRKNFIYPSKYINSTERGQIECNIGTFSTSTKKEVCLGYCVYPHSYCNIEDGEISLISWCKSCFPFKSVDQEKNVIMSTVFSFHATDNHVALQESRFNVTHTKAATLQKQFQYIYRAFKTVESHEPQAKVINAELKLFRPVISTVYGGVNFILQLSKKDICVTIPEFLKVKFPDERFPLHKSDTIYESVMRVLVFLKDKSPFNKENSIKEYAINSQTVKELKPIDIHYFVENFNYVTYKEQERLPTSISYMQTLNFELLKLIFNRQYQIVFSNCFSRVNEMLPLETHRVIVGNLTLEDSLQGPSMEEVIRAPSSFKAQFNPLTNFYDCILVSFIKHIDQGSNKELIEYLRIYLKNHNTKNYFHFGQSLDDDRIVYCLEELGLEVSFDKQEFELAD